MVPLWKSLCPPVNPLAKEFGGTGLYVSACLSVGLRLINVFSLDKTEASKYHVATRQFVRLD